MHSQIFLPTTNTWVPVEKSRSVLDQMSEEDRMHLPTRTVFPGSMGGGLRSGSVNTDRKTADFVISTEKPVVDTYYGPPTSLAADGMRAYNSNDKDPGPVLFMHEHTWVVGRTIKDWVQGKKNVARVEFDTEDELGAWMFGKVQRKFIRMASVGYRKLKWYDVAEGEKDKATGLLGPVRRVTEWERLEWSIVTVGANPDAVGRSMTGIGMTPAMIESVMRMFLRGAEPPHYCAIDLSGSRLRAPDMSGVCVAQGFSLTRSKEE